MTQLENTRHSRPIVKFQTRCGSSQLQRSLNHDYTDEEVPETYTGALSWMSRHGLMLRKFVNILRAFPNLAVDDDLQYFNTYLSEFYQSKVNAEQEKALNQILNTPHARRNPENYSLLSPSNIMVYITGEVCELQWTNTDFITRELAQHFNVRSDPGVYRTHAESFKVRVMQCNVFVFIISKASLTDESCIKQLIFAISNQIPVVLVRDPETVKLPESISESEISIVYNRPITVLSDIADKSPVLFLDDCTKPLKDESDRGVNMNMRKINKMKESGPQLTITLLEWLTKNISSAIVFTFEHRASCINKVVNGVRQAALGENFVDGFGSPLPTELTEGEYQIKLAKAGKEAKATEVLDSLMAPPTSSLWGGGSACFSCGQILPIKARIATPTPIPADPTLSKFLHYSQLELEKSMQQQHPGKLGRPSTAPSSLAARYKDSLKRTYDFRKAKRAEVSFKIHKDVIPNIASDDQLGDTDTGPLSEAESTGDPSEKVINDVVTHVLQDAKTDIKTEKRCDKATNEVVKTVLKEATADIVDPTEGVTKEVVKGVLDEATADLVDPTEKAISEVVTTVLKEATSDVIGDKILDTDSRGSSGKSVKFSDDTVKINK